MKCMKIGYNIQQDGETLNFTYKLEDGVAEKSFANNVAKMVGIPDEIMKIADEKAGEIIKQDKIASSTSFSNLVGEIDKLTIE